MFISTPPGSPKDARTSGRARAWITLLALATVALPATAIPVRIDTSSRAGEEAIFSIVLIDGDFAGNNFAEITDLQTDGTFGATECVIGCQGTPPLFRLDDDFFLGEFLQPLTLGSFLSLELSFSHAFNDVPNASSDLVIGELLGLPGFETNLDAAGASVPYQYALFVANLAGDSVVGAAGITVVGAMDIMVPEPAGLVLVMSGLALLGTRRKAFSPNHRASGANF